MIKRRVFISVPMDNHLDQGRRQVVQAVLQLISDAGFEPQRFLSSGLPASIGWNFQTVDEVMRRCVGAVIFALPRRTVSDVVIPKAIVFCCRLSGTITRARWQIRFGCRR
jgi:hypothetical protein